MSLYRNCLGNYTVLAVAIIMAEVPNPNDIVFAMMVIPMQLWLMSMVTVVSEIIWITLNMTKR